MLGPLFRDIAEKNNLTVSAGMAYGILGGCFVTLSEDNALRRISIYVGPQEQPAPGYSESMTVSCARQICAAISGASGAENAYALLTAEDAPALILNHAGSVVTANFPADASADAGIAGFLGNALPGVAQLTRPHLCILCAHECVGNAVPVRLSADTVVPMHLPCCRQVSGASPLTPEERAQQVRATLAAAGAALFAAAIWALTCRLGPLAWILGVLMGLLPTLAYRFLKGRKGRMCLITVLVCAVCAVIAGSLGAAFADAHHAWKRELTLMTANDIGYWAYALAALRLPVSSANGVLTKGLLAGTVAAAIGCIPCFRREPKEDAPTALAEKPRRMKGTF